MTMKSRSLRARALERLHRMTEISNEAAAQILNRVLRTERTPRCGSINRNRFDYPEMARSRFPRAHVRQLARDRRRAQHASHLFHSLDVGESIASNLASKKKAHDYVIAFDPEMSSFDELHAVDYMVYAYLQLGKDAEAKKHLDVLRSVKKLDNANFAAAYALSAAPARYALERRQWKEAASMSAGQHVIRALPLCGGEHSFRKGDRGGADRR